MCLTAGILPGMLLCLEPVSGVAASLAARILFSSVRSVTEQA